MKVWEVISFLSKLPAGDEVCISIGPSSSVTVDTVDADDGFAFLRSSDDPEIELDNGDTAPLSYLIATEG